MYVLYVFQFKVQQVMQIMHAIMPDHLWEFNISGNSEWLPVPQLPREQYHHRTSTALAQDTRQLYQCTLQGQQATAARVNTTHHIHDSY